MTETISFIKDSLSPFFPENEIQRFVRLILEHVTGLSPHQILMNKDKELSGMEKKEIREILHRLKQSEPIQYILGETEFYGLTFQVNPSVLIPRPETEELVEGIIRDRKGKETRLVDIGTGSGCIAVSLAHALPEARISAVDICSKALATARKNAEQNQVTVEFIESDILDTQRSKKDIPGELDCIVSNPPYVLHQEKEQMEKNVLDHEPHLAIFVPDTDPLLFYRAIAVLGREKLKEDGTLYFEINGMFGQEVVDLLKIYGYKNIQLKKDLPGKDRMIKAEK
ncbi:MAG: peptide chain release factor N(5)-glutamine methyltransferase [Tannerellaceae bacterium]|nr:peptide chain release factor N(5)-glutamine methyltransferase [Tannerellaceae bacterium]